MDDLDQFKISTRVQAKLKDRELLKRELASGKTVQEVLAFSDGAMAKFYTAAYHLFEMKRYREASNAFLFLATLNPTRVDYWIGLGMATQFCHKYEEAIDAYEMAAICQIDNPVPYFYLAKCLFAIHDRESALQALDLAIEYADDFEEFAELKYQARAARDSLMRG